MKKFFVILALALFPITTATSAQELYFGSDGSVKVIEAPVVYVATGVTVTPEAAVHATAIAQAYEDPGVLVTVTWSSPTIEKSSIFFVTFVKKGDQAVLFNSQENLISLVDSGELKKRDLLDFYLILVFLSAMSMGISWVTNKSAAAFAAFAAAETPDGRVNKWYYIVFYLLLSTSIMLYLVMVL